VLPSSALFTADSLPLNFLSAASFKIYKNVKMCFSISAYIFYYFFLCNFLLTAELESWGNSHKTFFEVNLLSIYTKLDHLRERYYYPLFNEMVYFETKDVLCGEY